MDVTRRQLVALGTAGAAGAIIGRGALTGSSAAEAASAPGRGVHFHGTVVYRGDPPPGVKPNDAMAGMDADQPMAGMASDANQSMGSMGMMRMAATDYMHVINVDVWGPDSDLSGNGWGATAGSADPNQPTPVDGLQCFFTQRGTLEGDVVKLTGRMLFSGDPADPGGTIATEANLATGEIRFIGQVNHALQFILTGTGVVIRT
jgi:hypothetical protein